MFGWIRERLDTARLTRERADRLASENKQLRELAHAKQQEVDRLNSVIDDVHAVVMGWSRASKSKGEIGV